MKGSQALLFVENRLAMPDPGDRRQVGAPDASSSSQYSSTNDLAVISHSSTNDWPTIGPLIEPHRSTGIPRTPPRVRRRVRLEETVATSRTDEVDGEQSGLDAEVA